MRVAIGDLSKFDPERAVLPAILFAKKKSNNVDFDGEDVTFYAWSLALGWWRWGVRVSHVYSRTGVTTAASPGLVYKTRVEKNATAKPHHHKEG